ncbi:hypothetical protein AX774_g4671 [Zancudomyces culisetae]|uniref:Uncharacterized protein n=1 Tax=Zancudomyces culisetae TaxID=1213189 RepID=A0A1R1PLL8_ZANCU|nr:hypothetical protein AX774_g4671 [Zancudomyces culisetae]|eukprot:OMH81856.1 hypothetical protein AX774_g4671 [Zancudomyces culisetae]
MPKGAKKNRSNRKSKSIGGGSKARHQKRQQAQHQKQNVDQHSNIKPTSNPVKGGVATINSSSGIYPTHTNKRAVKYQLGNFGTGFESSILLNNTNNSIEFNDINEYNCDNLDTDIINLSGSNGSYGSRTHLVKNEDISTSGENINGLSGINDVPGVNGVGSVNTRAVIGSQPFTPVVYHKKVYNNPYFIQKKPKVLEIPRAQRQMSNTMASKYAIFPMNFNNVVRVANVQVEQEHNPFSDSHNLIIPHHRDFDQGQKQEPPLLDIDTKLGKDSDLGLDYSPSLSSAPTATVDNMDPKFTYKDFGDFKYIDTEKQHHQQQQEQQKQEQEQQKELEGILDEYDEDNLKTCVEPSSTKNILMGAGKDTDADVDEDVPSVMKSFDEYYHNDFSTGGKIDKLIDEYFSDLMHRSSGASTSDFYIDEDIYRKHGGGDGDKYENDKLRKLSASSSLSATSTMSVTSVTSELSESSIITAFEPKYWEQSCGPKTHGVPQDGISTFYIRRSHLVPLRELQDTSRYSQGASVHEYDDAAHIENVSVDDEYDSFLNSEEYKYVGGLSRKASEFNRSDFLIVRDIDRIGEFMKNRTQSDKNTGSKTHKSPLMSSQRLDYVVSGSNRNDIQDDYYSSQDSGVAGIYQSQKRNWSRNKRKLRNNREKFKVYDLKEWLLPTIPEEGVQTISSGKRNMGIYDSRRNDFLGSDNSDGDNDSGGGGGSEMDIEVGEYNDFNSKSYMDYIYGYHDQSSNARNEHSDHTKIEGKDEDIYGFENYVQ